MAWGLADIPHVGVVVATHAQRDRKPRALEARRARDATAGLTVTRLADGAGVVSFAGASCTCGRRCSPPSSTSRSWPDPSSCPGTDKSSACAPSATTAPASWAPSPAPKSASLQGLRHRQHRLYDHVAQQPKLTYRPVPDLTVVSSRGVEPLAGRAGADCCGPLASLLGNSGT